MVFYFSLVVGLFELVLEYLLLVTTNVVTRSVFNALSIDEGSVTAVLLCMKRGVFYQNLSSIANHYFAHQYSIYTNKICFTSVGLIPTPRSARQNHHQLDLKRRTVVVIRLLKCQRVTNAKEMMMTMMLSTHQNMILTIHLLCHLRLMRKITSPLSRRH